MQPLFETSQLDRDLIAINQAAAGATAALVNAIQQINHSYQVVWSLPDDRLVNVLQYMVDHGRLQEIMELHYASATGLNAVAEVAGVSGRAFSTVPRPFVVGEDGKVTLSPP